jgi:hypothetical protein|eukprot:SAG25_NODE_24_length_22161_cov_23.692405_14_plen_61_part_00
MSHPPLALIAAYCFCETPFIAPQPCFAVIFLSPVCPLILLLVCCTSSPAPLEVNPRRTNT